MRRRRVGIRCIGENRLTLNGLSVVTGTFNRIESLKAFVQSVRKCIPDGFLYEIILVDGGSSDGTIEWAESQTDVKLIQHGQLLGAIKAFGDGARAARFRYVMLANDDVVLHDNSILPAILHLEEQPLCGAVAYEDNRRIDDTPNLRQYHVLKAPAIRNHQPVMLPYAQVGMFRRWLGNYCGWWGDLDPDFPARTYAGDNRLSSKIWELGYTVDSVEGCRVDDSVMDDALRDHNRMQHPEKDSDAYYDLWRDESGKHTGPKVPPFPVIPQEDKRALRILYLPIFETNQDPANGKSLQQAQKCGLKRALQKVGIVYEYDYVNEKDNVGRDLPHILNTFQPDMMLTQFHGADLITFDLLANLRQMRPNMVVANWNGDTHRSNLINPTMLKFLSLVDLQLVVNHSVIEVYEQQGINAAYWQIAYEPVDPPYVYAPTYHIVFQGTAYNDHRKRMGAMLRKLPYEVGIYGDWWDAPLGEPFSRDLDFVPAGAQGRTLYDFAFSTALYRNAKIAIGSNEFPNDYGFVSNRIFECLAAGNCLFLQQHVDGLEELTGITPNKHYIEWTDLADLRDKIEYWLDPKHASQRKRIAASGTKYVREFHSFDVRVRQLFGVGEFKDKGLLALAKRRLAKYTGLRYTGKLENGGIVGISGREYTLNAGQVLWVDPTDVQNLMQNGVFERVNGSAPDDVIARAVEYG